MKDVSAAVREAAGDRIIGRLIGLCWLLVAGLGALSWLEPCWFIALMEPGRVSEARDVKGQGDLALRQGNLAAAASAYAQALSVNPELQAAKGNLGIVLMKQGRLDEARRIFLEMLDEDPAQLEIAAEHLGRISEVQGRQAEATDWYERSASSSAYPAAVWSQAGRLRLAQGAAPEALTLLQRSLEAETSLACLLQGMLWRQVPLAADSLKKLVCLRRTGVQAKDVKPYASWVLDWCSSRSHQVTKTQYLLSRAHAMLGDTALALELCDQALACWPTFPDARGWRFKIVDGVNSSESAMATMSRP